VYYLKSALVFAAALGLAACTQTSVDLEQRQIDIEQTASPASASAGTDRAALRPLLDRTGPTYVTLTVSRVTGEGSSKDANKRNLTSGSGFVVQADGYVMTAAHVAVQSGNIVSARAADGRIYSGKVIGVLPKNDMALVRLTSFSGHAVSPARSSCLAKGDTVFSLGKPHAQGDVARMGQVEAMHFGRAVRYGQFGYPDAMVLKMDTKKGESGGPLFNADGKLSGMIVSTLADGNGKPLSLAHAIPVSSLAAFLCAKTSCSGDWQALAAQGTESCGSS
jgi:S1-C subfamily serine protease